MEQSAAEMAKQVALVASEFQRQRTGHAPQSVSVVLSEDTLVVTLLEALTPAEKALSQTPQGAVQVQEFHRQLFANSVDEMRQEIKRITGRQVRESAAEVETATGTVVQAFTTDAMVQVFLLTPRELGATDESTTTARGDYDMTSDKLPDFAEADRDLLQRVNGFLCQRGYGPHRTLEISIERGVVVVQGRVPTFYLQQIAVECIKRVAGVIQVLDSIEVGDDPRQPNDNVDDKRKSPTVATRHSVDLPDLARTAQGTHRPHIRNRHRLSSVKG